MPARRRSYSQKRYAKKKRIRLLFLVFFGLFFLGFIFYLRLQRTFWDGESKLPLIIDKGAEGAVVAIFDPMHEEIVTINIPPSTQMQVARKLGVWKLESIWQLGENEGLDGKLLTETISRHFNFPVAAWAGKEAAGFISPNPSVLVRSALSPQKTNLTLSDRLSLALFSSSVQPTNRIDINLEETVFLEEKNLKSGETGYVLSGRPSPQIHSLFADPQISESFVSVSIEDSTGVAGIAENLGKTTEVLGAKLASIQNEDDKDIDCVVSSEKQEIAEKFALLFGCDASQKETLEGFDVQIKIGKKFADRY